MPVPVIPDAGLSCRIQIGTDSDEDDGRDLCSMSLKRSPDIESEGEQNR